MDYHRGVFNPPAGNKILVLIYTYVLNLDLNIIKCQI